MLIEVKPESHINKWYNFLGIHTNDFELKSMGSPNSYSYKAISGISLIGDSFFELDGDEFTFSHSNIVGTRRYTIKNQGNLISIRNLKGSHIMDIYKTTYGYYFQYGADYGKSIVIGNGKITIEEVTPPDTFQPIFGGNQSLKVIEYSN